MPTLSLKYGKACLSCSVSETRTLRVKQRGPFPDPLNAIRRALDNPIGTSRLREIVQPGEQVVIVTSDITRYTASELYLPVLTDDLNRCGIRDRDITILIGLGIHRKQTTAEHRQIVGQIYNRFSVVDHEVDQPSELIDLGSTSSGFPVHVNRRLVEADRIIVTGTISLHYFAGFGGGRKGLIPGVASRTTCMATHFAIFNPVEIGGRSPQARPANLQGNPVHHAILEAARMVNPDFLLNTVLTPDKKIAGVYCGDLEKAHLKGCLQAKDLYTVPIDRLADLAIVSCGGHPKDINFIQAHKALDYSVQAVKPGGTLILLAACPDGFGNDSFFHWFQNQDLQNFEWALRSNYEINGQTAFATLLKARSWRIILVSSFTREQTERMGMEKASDLNEALMMAKKKLPRQPDIVVIPEGGIILPELTSQWI
ncbi:MAG: nickel-dependent lactate racemase [Deltaproteobacteria bacterium]|nr:nickel-dependent lactate racemase [Deltaproteobacteria bacterium]